MEWSLVVPRPARGWALRRALRIVSSVTLSTATAACGIIAGPDDREVNVQISGTVTSADDGTPVPGILVEVWAGSWFGGDSRRVTQTRSRSDGTYSLQTGTAACDSYALQAAWEPGDGYRVAVSSYPTDAARFSRSIACTDEPQVIDINLQPDDAAR